MIGKVRKEKEGKRKETKGNKRKQKETKGNERIRKKTCFFLFKITIILFNYLYF